MFSRGCGGWRRDRAEEAARRRRAFRDDPLVAAFQREGMVLLRYWAAGSTARRRRVERDYATYMRVINRARLLRARLARRAMKGSGAASARAPY